MKRIGIYLEVLLSLPKSLYFNFKYFPFATAIKLPVLISYRTKLSKMEGNVILEKIKTGIVRIGFGYVGIFDKNNSRSIWECTGHVFFKGATSIGHGSKLSIGKNGKLIFGNNFCITAESQIVCNKKILIGDNVLISWQCLIMDTDFHNILNGDIKINDDKEIIIRNNVWIGCRSTILKGVEIYSGNVIAANTNLTRTIRKSHIIIGGNPGNIIKENINWSC